MSPFSSDEYPQHSDEQLYQAYLNAEYIFNGFTLKVGHLHREFDDWLTGQGYLHYAYLTAHNPHSRLLPPAENIHRQVQLQALLRNYGMVFAPAEGRDPAGSWPAETGVFLFDVLSGEVHELARIFGQNAVVEGKVGGVPFLVWV